MSDPADRSTACECGDCEYVTPDCCGEPRPRCETGSAYDFYMCSVSKGCDVGGTRLTLKQAQAKGLALVEVQA